MNIYVSTFISGLDEPIQNALKKYIKDVTIIRVLDGMIIYKTNANIENIINLKFFNNSFILLYQISFTSNNPIEDIIKKAINNSKTYTNLLSHYKFNKKNTFRVITSIENKLVPINSNLMLQIEKKIKSLTKLSVCRDKPENEFWVLYRREKLGLFMLRITKNRVTEKNLHKGELKPELAFLLNYLSNPYKNDIFIDPFCGYGAIPKQRILNYSSKFVYATDIDKSKLNLILNKKEFKKSNVIVEQMDGLKLPTVEDCSINTIVTDPPWGIYDNLDISINLFYFNMLKCFYRILNNNGTAVILTAKKEEFEESINKLHDLLIINKKYNILVSGKKASIYIIKKKH